MSDGTLDERMALLARDLRSRDSAGDTLQHIVEAAVELVDGAGAAAISLATSVGKVRTSAYTHDYARRADELQQDLMEGPCLDAVWREKVVCSPHLATDVRWPRWAPRAVEDLGVSSMLCVQLFTHENRLGALNLFSTRPAAFTADDVAEAQAVAAHAAVAVAAVEQLVGLASALESRTVTAQATGVVMATYTISSHQAFALLRRLSSERNVKLRIIAQEIVERHDTSVER